MKAQRLYTVLLCSLLFSALSCIKEEPGITDEDGLVRVPVNLNLSVDAVIDGTPDTKSIIEPEIVPSLTDAAQIKNIVVLQFNGVTSTARLVGGQTYFDHWPLTGDEQLTLVASGTAANTVVVLANTFDRISISSNTTLGQFLAQDYTTISGLSGVMTTSGGNEYFRLSGSLEKVVEGQTTVDIALKRNVAKIVVNVTNNTPEANKVTISKVQLRDINAKYYYLAHIDPDLTAEDPLLIFTDIYSEAYPCRFDNAQEDFTGTTQTYTYYVPANLRGTTDNEYQYSKGLGAPKGATRFCIYGTYGTSNTPINYTYYLGANLTDDFNLLPNYKYTYNITINSKGNAYFDYRIEDMGEVKFETDANCYMLHPPTVSGQSRIYAIPVRRAAVFWNESDHLTDPGVYGARKFVNNNYFNNDLKSDSPWDAEVLWSDFDMAPYPDFLQVASGTGYDPTDNQQHPYFKVKVHSGMSGNVVVGIKKNGGSDILWSWHLWITDYNPDKNVATLTGKYVYGVDNGNIHRYTGKIWTTLPDDNSIGYANGFIMDRNLGAIGTTVNSFQSFGLYYQWGRKDPFAWGTTGGDQGYFYLNGTASALVLSGGVNNPEKRNMYNDNSQYLGADEYKNIRYTVTHPLVFICSNDTSYGWTKGGDDLGDGGISTVKWNDRKFWLHTGDQAILELKKSIYDPCPPGWVVPIAETPDSEDVGGTWNGFTRKTPENEEAGTYTTDWTDGGRYYFPEGYVNRNTTGIVYYPASGYRTSGIGGVNNPYREGYCWSGTNASAIHGWNFYFNSSSVYTKNGNNRANAMNVRCVRE